MANKLAYEVCISVGESGPPNDKKKIWRRIGSVIRDDQTGSMSMKLELIPMPHVEWSGWARLFEPRHHQNSSSQPATGYPSNEREAARQPAPAFDQSAKQAENRIFNDDFKEDDIPF